MPAPTIGSVPPPTDPEAVIDVRTVWISDLHLGTPGCQAEALLEFLRDVQCETLYLVGDIIDGWQLRRNWFWPQAHNDVVQKILRKARKGTRVVFVPGNHDEFARKYVAHNFGGVDVVDDAGLARIVARRGSCLVERGHHRGRISEAGAVHQAHAGTHG